MKKIIATVVLLSLVSMINLPVIASDKTRDIQTSNEESKLTDGPYIDVLTEQQLFMTSICNGEVIKATVKQQEKRATQVDQCSQAKHAQSSVILQTNPQREPLEFYGDFDVVAVSDFHGQYQIMFELLQRNNIIDQEGNWRFANGHLVITGDVFDRGDKVTEILWFLYRLEQQAKAAGGFVHLLVGNHEVMVLNGDLRYLHPKYIDVARQLNRSFEQLYNSNSIIGRWLRSKNVLVKINDSLFAHGGFHPDLVKKKLSLASINQYFVDNLVKLELAEPRDELASYLHKSDGPVWYRGYFKEPKASEQEIDLLLSHFDVNRIVVGHTSRPQIESHFQGKVIAIDSSIKRGEYGELLLIDGDELSRLTLFGASFPLNVN